MRDEVKFTVYKLARKRNRDLIRNHMDKHGYVEFQEVVKALQVLKRFRDRMGDITHRDVQLVLNTSR